MKSPEELRRSLCQLSPAQATAVMALAGGATHDAAARGAGVTRETVTRWSGHHSGFRAALNEQRYALAMEQNDLARRIRAKALAVIDTALDGDERVGTALNVLKLVAVEFVAQPIPADEQLDQDLAERARHVPPPPPKRDHSGRVSVLDAFDVALDPTAQADRSERARTLATERLAGAAGLSAKQS